MKILFLCHRFPLPVDGGGKIRALNILRHLLESGHAVTLAAVIGSSNEARLVPELEALGARVEVSRVYKWLQILRMLVAVPTAKPSSFAYFFSRSLSRRINELLRIGEWDLILIHCSAVAGYVPRVTKAQKIVDFADMDSLKWLDYAQSKPLPAKLVFALEARKVERQELRIAQSADFCTTISRGELMNLQALNSDTPSDWFPNGVDLDFFSPSQDSYDANLIVFVGRMNYYPNEQAMCWFCEAVWPILREKRPQLKLRIVGADPSPKVRALRSFEGVEVTGSVPDVRPYARQAALSVVPLKIARGLQNKVLESLAMGVPVVTTRRVASGLGLDDSGPLRLASTGEEYVQEILSIVDSPAQREQLSLASRALVERNFAWPRALAKLDSIIDSSIRAAK